MSFLHTKTNYVRPHAKASFIRPLCNLNENDSLLKESGYSFSTVNHVESPIKESGSLHNLKMKNIDDDKENHLQNLNLAHTKLFTEFDKIQSWSTSVESEFKQKCKIIKKLTETAESQRKVISDLQMENEKLSMQKYEEIQNRVSVLDKFHFTKELFLTLKKKFQDLQLQINTYQKVKETIEACCKENIKVVEDLTQKFSFLSLQNSENVAILSDALKSEKQNNFSLKELCEQQNQNFEKEHKSLCKLIENYQEELKNYSNDLEKEKNNTSRLEQEKKNLSLEVSKLETTKEEYFKKWQDTKNLMQTISDKKDEFEKKYDSECIKVNVLNEKCKDLEECSNKQKLEFEENCSSLKATIASLENSIADLKQKIEESEHKNENLSETLQERENEKFILEKKISDFVEENEKLQNQLTVNASTSAEKIDLLMKEKDDFSNELLLLKEELEKIIIDKENLSKSYSDKDEKLAEITKEYEASISKLNMLSNLENTYDQTLKKVEKMEIDLQLKSDLLISKEEQIKELFELKTKFNKNLIKMKKLEELVQLKSEQLDLKNTEIQKLDMTDETLFEALNKIIENLENELSSKNELLTLKDMKVEEMNVLEEKLSEALNKIDYMEKELFSKNELLNSKDMKVEEMNVIEEKLFEALNKIDDMEKELFSKNKLLNSKDINIEEKNYVEQKYTSVLQKVTELEEDVKLKEEKINNQEKKIIDLNSILKEKNKKLEKLEYENFEMKDSIDKEKESVKICLECEMMKEKVNELDLLRVTLMETEKMLFNQRQQTSKVTKMLSETEDNFDEMRIKKEKEIIKYKETIESLQHEIRILKVEVGEVEKLRCEIQSLQLVIEKQKLQHTDEKKRLKSENEKIKHEIEDLKIRKTDDKQKLKSEYEKIKTEIETLKTRKDISVSQCVKGVSKKQLENIQEIKSEKRLNKSDHQMKMEADSFFDEVAIIKEVAQPTSSTNSKIYVDVNEKVNQKIANFEDRPSTPTIPEKRKRAWESESSGSECLEIVFDKDAKRLMGFTPKNRSISENKKTPTKSAISVTSTPVIGSAQRTKIKAINNFTPKILLNRKSVQADAISEDFISGRSSAKADNLGDSPWHNGSVEIKRTPSTPANRKFFKTPLKERELSLKKPPSKKLWF